MRHFILLAIILSLGKLTGCSTANTALDTAAKKEPFCNERLKQHPHLNKYLNADPVEDARKALGKGDIQFLAVYGFTNYVPGVPDFSEKYSQKYTFFIIEGTSDAFHSPSDMALQLQVTDYAKKYNQTLLSHIEGKVENTH